MKTSVNWANFPTFIIQVGSMGFGSACFGFNSGVRVLGWCWEYAGDVSECFLGS